MGSFYSNITLRGPGHARIVQALEARHRQAYVGPQTDGFVVVFDERIDENPDQAPGLARELSAELGGVALAATVHDDDIFVYTLVRDGQVVDEYNSRPGYFTGEHAPPQGGNAELLASIFGAGNAAAIERILRASGEEGGDYVFESGRHGDLAEVLGLPAHSVGYGYNYVYQGDAEELEGDLTTVGDTDQELYGSHAPAPSHEELLQRMSLTPGGQMMRNELEAMNAAGKHPAHGYFAALLAGDAAAVRALFDGPPVLDDPVSGRVEGEAMDAHVAAAHALFAAGTTRYLPLGLIETPERTVGFGQILGEAAEGPLMLACACVCERAEGGFRELRAYWTPAALKGQRGERAPILPPNADLPLPEAVAAHLKALAADDVDAAAATYDSATLAPVPLPWLDPGDTVRRDYGAQVGQQGAVVLAPCTATTTDAACAVEFVTTQWDGAEVPAQAGLAIYDLRGGRIGAVRLYGDLAPAPLAGLGGLGALGGMAGFDPFGPGAGGMAGLGDLGGMTGLGDLGAMGGAMEMPPEAMQQAMEEVMRMMSGPGGLAGMMENLQKMIGGMGGMGGFPGLGGQAGMGGMDLGAFAGFPGMGGGAGWDDDEDDGADASPSASGTSATGGETADGDADRSTESASGSDSPSAGSDSGTGAAPDAKAGGEDASGGAPK